MKINRFKESSPGLVARAQDQIKEVLSQDSAPMAPKVQRMGPTRLIAESLATNLPIDRHMSLEPSRVRIPEAFERDGDEYKDAEFRALVESIKQTGGNVDPIDVRLINGVPGFDAELLAGTRRLMACRELGLAVAATVRRCDDRMADLIHETENSNRKSKAPYSRGLQYKRQMESGRYSSQRDLAENIKVNPSDIARYISLLTDAPEGMWEKVSDRGSINTAHTQKLLAAYKKESFRNAVKQAESLTAKQLVDLAGLALKPTRDTRKADWKLAKRGKSYTVVFPENVSEDVARGAMEAAKKYVENARK